MSDSLKRRVEEVADGDDSDDDFGPKPATVAANVTDDTNIENSTKRKKLKKLAFEKTYIDNLPSGELYEHSFMHRDLVTHVAVAKVAEFIITGSADGHVKFWKKMPDNIEFVKHFQAHLGPIHALVVSPDDLRLVTTSADKMIKFFEILSFDMSHMISADYTPTAAVWLSSHAGLYSKVAVADSASGVIRIYKSDGLQPLNELTFHTQPVK
jgi:peptidylprolyl isomerase domain and WD repeat-containing protein 1